LNIINRIFRKNEKRIAVNPKVNTSHKTIYEKGKNISGKQIRLLLF